MKFKHGIMKPGNLNEKSYEGNLGFEELAKFYQVANNNQIKEMENIIKKENGREFKTLIKKGLT